MKFSNSLLLGAMYRFENPSYNYGATVPTPLHPSFADFLELIEEWWTATCFEAADELSMTVMAARNHLMGASERLRELVVKTIHEHDTKGLENPLNSGIRSALDELARQRLFIDLSTAIHLAENTDSNAEIGALSHIGSIGTREALDYLLKRSRHDSHNYYTIFQGIETISSRLGLKVLESNSGLVLDLTS